MNNCFHQQAEVWRAMETFNRDHARVLADAGMPDVFLLGKAQAYGLVADEYENRDLIAPQGRRITCTCNNWPDGCYNAQG